MGRMSREKGKRGEREWAAVCREHGYDARRTAQHCGKSGDAADVIGLPGIHMEVKRVEHLDLYGALDQAKRDARPGKIPIVAHRRNDCRWVVIMDAENWFRIYREYEAGRPRTEIGIEEEIHDEAE